ncbi:MAG: hypothetical protein HYV08_07385 [Deltaproteobacteria bacterium]|nr:hypothetical protein [Deltaproteobacteria bacterium]MBI3075843.1 hypothetical protein [Deltaproteobacteria bacterium]
MKRYECLEAIAGEVGDALAVTTAGATTLEWNRFRPSDGNLMCKTLGLVSSISLGIALGLPQRKVLALDGDGALLMNLCALPTIAWRRPPNFIHIVFDNGIYESSGARATATSAGADLVEIARGAGYPHATWTTTVDEFRKEVQAALGRYALSLIGAKVEPGRCPVPPLELDEVENKYRFIRYIERSEGMKILTRPLPASYRRAPLG